MVKISLNNNRWVYKDNFWFTGFLISNNRYYRKYDAVDILKREFININEEEEEEEEFLEKANQLNGHFTIIITDKNGEATIITDKIRSYPLFLVKKEDTLLITDQNEKCFNIKSSLTQNRDASDLFLRCGYTLNNSTLFNEIKITEAAQIIKTDKGDASFVNYLKYYSENEKRGEDLQTLSKQLSSILDNIFKRLCSNIGSSPVAIPLSGGYDSRLIAVMMKKYHTGKIYLYTYGRRNNEEVKAAKLTAERLNLKWIFIEYNKNNTTGFINSSTFKNYICYAANYSSMFFMQDYFALKEIKEKKLFPQNTVFIPGHSADLVAGSHLIEDPKKLDRKRQIDIIFKTHFNNIKTGYNKRLQIIEEIKKTLPKNIEPLDYWSMHQRQPKFIVNSCRAFEFWGYQYLLPFWEDQFHLFFLKLPVTMRLNKKLYNKTVKDIFNQYNLNFVNELEPGRRKKELQIFKNRIKQLFPAALVNLFTKNRSPFLYDIITKEMKRATPPSFKKTPTQLNFYNAYIMQWYLFYLFGKK
ncbi:asparagine synthase C-terminal domain-containing protein [Marinilabiliaceae bacterium ANBcel2]|nr:asparagine synthase C-terminal domain-containing protein [Marinilabiliaceae bacterium ANBcel2]